MNKANTADANEWEQCIFLISERMIDLLQSNLTIHSVLIEAIPFFMTGHALEIKKPCIRLQRTPGFLL